MPGRRRFQAPYPAWARTRSTRSGERTMSFRISPLAAVLVLSGVAGTVAAQASSAEGSAIALALTAEPESTTTHAHAPALGPAPSALKPAYKIRLTSRWSQEPALARCRNGWLETF